MQGPEEQGKTPQRPAESPTEGPRAGGPPAAAPPTSEEPKRFNPFVNEGDMFKVVLWAGAICAALVLLATLARALF